MKMTKEMFEKCFNEDKIVFDLMDEDVKDTLRAYDIENQGRNIEYLSFGQWRSCNPSFFPNDVYRINPMSPNIEIIDSAKTLITRCLNIDKKIFADLDKDVQDELQQWLNKYGKDAIEVISLEDGEWWTVSDIFVASSTYYKLNFNKGRIFRISKEFYDKIGKEEHKVSNTPIDAKTLLKVPITVDDSGVYTCSLPSETGYNKLTGIEYDLCTAVCHKDFYKIEYETNSGNSVYSTSIDPRLGTPVSIEYKTQK